MVIIIILINNKSILWTQFFDRITQNLLPDDYEEGKRLDLNQKINNLNETIAILKRFHQYKHNIIKAKYHFY